MTDEELSDITGHDDQAISDMAAELLAARARLREMEGALRERIASWVETWGDDNPAENIAAAIRAGAGGSAHALAAQPAESGAKEELTIVVRDGVFDDYTGPDNPLHYAEDAQGSVIFDKGPLPPVPQEPGDDEALLRGAYANSLACDEINDELWNGVVKRGAIQELSIRHLLAALRAARASERERAVAWACRCVEGHVSEAIAKRLTAAIRREARP